MRANPGGEIAPADVIGRELLIRQLWQTLEQQSVILAAERRMGKSCVVKKMIAESPENIPGIYRDVENIETPIEFVELIYEDVATNISPAKRTATRVQTLLQKLSGTQISGIGTFPEIAAPHWKVLLEETLAALAENSEKTILFFWDEFPLMLQKVSGTSGERAAMEVLDTLRRLRQTHSNIRMLYTGSIGLHHVTTALRNAGHSNDATNDMLNVEVEPLSKIHACELVEKLLEGEKFQGT